MWIGITKSREKKTQVNDIFCHFFKGLNSYKWQRSTIIVRETFRWKNTAPCKTRYKFQLTYPWAPPVVLVLWCISFHVIWLDSPVVMEVPTVKTNRALKALCSSCKTSLPSRLSGKYAVRCVPLYRWPGFGCSGPWIPDWKEYWMQMVPHPYERKKKTNFESKFYWS